MKVWHTFGAFGDTVVELSWRDVVRLLLGKTVHLDCVSVAISLGKSDLKSLGQAPSREQQLREAV